MTDTLANMDVMGMTWDDWRDFRKYTGGSGLYHRESFPQSPAYNGDSGCESCSGLGETNTTVEGRSARELCACVLIRWSPEN